MFETNTAYQEIYMGSSSVHKITSFRYTTLIQSTGMIQAQAQPVRKGVHILFL